MTFFSITLFVLLYMLTVSVGLYWVDWHNPVSVVYFITFQLIMLGFSYDTVEMLLGLLLRKCLPPKLKSLKEYPPVALLYTVCNDVMPDCLGRLRHQTYPNYDVYILDDSSEPACQNALDSSGYRVVRRGTRHGFKAGNLNHWLDKCGDRYKYFVIFDSDSKAEGGFIEEMMKYAEHPANNRIAIFQSKIHSWNTDSPFERILGAMAPLRMRIAERVGNRLGTTMSFGHNNLHRTELIQRVGGFTERVTPEDTAVTMTLSEEGFSCKIVDIVSYDTEPSDILRNTRRSVRWGQQTAEMFCVPWVQAPTMLKLLLCRHLYTYLIGIVYIFLLVASAWTLYPSPRETVSLILNQLLLFPAPQSVTLMALYAAIIGNLLLRFMLAIISKVSLRDFALDIVLRAAINCFAAIPVAIQTIRTLAGVSIDFAPTNAGRSRAITFTTILWEMRYSALLGAVMVVGIMRSPASLVGNLNGFWIILFLASPIILYALSKKHCSDQHDKQSACILHPSKGTGTECSQA
jgi:membrane glycosyltransferase